MKHRFKDWILYEDDRCIVINKPPFISSLDERDLTKDSVIRLAKDYHEDSQLCHRLDKETSGVLLIAKDPDTYRELSMAFEDRMVEKVYHAIVDGPVQLDEAVVELPIFVTKSGKPRIDPGGKDAITLFQSLEVFGHHTLMECMPVTGRMHQIRLHLRSQNFPISADELYGGKQPYLSRYKKNFHTGRGKEETPMIGRFALHAYSLFLKTDTMELDIKAPYPKDFDVFVKLLRKYDHRQSTSLQSRK